MKTSPRVEAPRLEEIYAPIAPGLSESERVLERLILSAGGPVAASSAAIARGGKRVRGALFLAAHSAGANGSHAATDRSASRFAALVEAIHLASLLHDDVLDRADLRRGVPSVNGLHGDQVAVLAGDLLYAKVFIEFLTDLPLGPVRILSNGARRMIEGEILQTLQSGRLPSEAEHCEAIRLKTAAFFAAVAEGGAALGRGPEATEADLDPYRRFGEAFGMCFQLVDDVLDWTGDPSALGNRTGADVASGKATLPAILFAAESGDADAFARALRGDASDFVAGVLASNALERARDRSRAEAARARAALAEIPPGTGREVLAGLLDFLLRRDR